MNERCDTNYSFLSTVNINMEYFTHIDIKGSDWAHDLQHLLGWPSDKQLINDPCKNLILNCPVLLGGVRHAHAIYGPATAILNEKIG